MLFLKPVLVTVGSIPFAPVLSLLLDYLTPWLFIILFVESMYDRIYIGLTDNVPNETFDFIIVGGGASGSVVANRLSVNHRVLLLEAGGTPVNTLNNPILAFVTHGRFPVDWMYRTVPQAASSRGLNNNQTAWPSGKTLGGSTNINGMIYVRGTVQGYDTMANFTGDQDWALENILKYYNKVEDYNGFFDKADHGSGGNLKIETGNQQPFVDNWLGAAEELGYKIRDPNPNGPLTEGIAPMDFYMEKGRRWDAYDGYLSPAMSRNNLVVRKNSYVYKVLMDENNQINGVEYEQYGSRKFAKCSKEVVLSAGSIQSAKILMLSGIGPEDHLKEIGIEPRVNLPVGQNLMDKYGAIVGPFTISPGQSFLRDRDLTLDAVVSYLLFGTGVMASTTAEGTFSILTDGAKSRGALEVPDADIYLLAQSVDNRLESDFARSFNYNPEVLKYFAKSRGVDGFTQFVTLPKPIGTGVMKLKDKGLYSMPLLDPKYLQNRQDMDTLVEGIKFAVKLVEETEAFRKINGSLLPFPLPGCEGPAFRSDAYWECVGRSTTLTGYKYCSTAPIGRDTTDPVAVVDSKLRVFGVKGLRVVDGSVLREKYVSINAVTCMMLGELGSDFILSDYTQKPTKNHGNLTKDKSKTENLSKMVAQLGEETLQEIIDQEIQTCARGEPKNDNVFAQLIKIKSSNSDGGKTQFRCPV